MKANSQQKSDDLALVEDELMETCGGMDPNGDDLQQAELDMDTLSDRYFVEQVGRDGVITII